MMSRSVYNLPELEQEIAQTLNINIVTPSQVAQDTKITMTTAELYQLADLIRQKINFAYEDGKRSVTTLEQLEKNRGEGKL